MERNIQKYSWDSKIDKAIFRGTTTGKLQEDGKFLGRLKLIKMSQEYPSFLDASFTRIEKDKSWVFDHVSNKLEIE